MAMLAMIMLALSDNRQAVNINIETEAIIKVEMKVVVVVCNSGRSS